MRNRTLVILGAVLLVLTIADRVLKICALRVFPAEGIFIFDQVLGLRLEYNAGIAYGLGIGRPWVAIILISGAALALSAYAARLWLQRKQLPALAVGSIIIGALSNLVDRIQYGAVIDYFFIAGMPRFNLADALIASGVILWLLLLWRRQLDEPVRLS